MDVLNQKPLKVEFQTQNPDEKVFFVLRKDTVTNIPWIINLIFMIFLPLILIFWGKELIFWNELPFSNRSITIWIWYLACIGYALLKFTRWYYHVFIITDSRVLDVDLIGFLYRDVAEAQLKNVQDVSHRQGGIFQLIFNYGDIFIQTSATKQNIELIKIPNPGEVHDVITDLVAEAGKRKGGQPHVHNQPN